MRPKTGDRTWRDSIPGRVNSSSSILKAAPQLTRLQQLRHGPECYVYETLRNEEGQQGVVKIDRDTGEIVRL